MSTPAPGETPSPVTLAPGETPSPVTPDPPTPAPVVPTLLPVAEPPEPTPEPTPETPAPVPPDVDPTPVPETPAPVEPDPDPTPAPVAPATEAPVEPDPDPTPAPVAPATEAPVAPVVPETPAPVTAEPVVDPTPAPAIPVVPETPAPVTAEPVAETAEPVIPTLAPVEAPPVPTPEPVDTPTPGPVDVPTPTTTAPVAPVAPPETEAPVEAPLVPPTPTVEPVQAPAAPTIPTQGPVEQPPTSLEPVVAPPTASATVTNAPVEPVAPGTIQPVAPGTTVPPATAPTALAPSAEPVIGVQPSVPPVAAPSATIGQDPTVDPIAVVPSPPPAAVVPSPPPAPVVGAPPTPTITTSPAAVPGAPTAEPALAPVVPLSPGQTAAPAARDLPIAGIPTPAPIAGGTARPAAPIVAPVVPGAPTLVSTRAPVDPADIPKTPAPVLPPDQLPPTTAPATQPTPAPLAPGSTRAPVPTPVPVATPAPSANAPSVSGVLTISVAAIMQCEEGCEVGLANAFDVQPYLVRCSCPEVEITRRSLGGWLTEGWNSTSVSPTEGSYYLRRRLEEPSDAGFVVTVPGTTTSGLIQSINYFQNNFDRVSEAMGVDSEDVQFSSLQFSATSFSPITEEASNSDVQLVVNPPASDASAAAVGMFVLFLVALLLGTCGCLWAILGFCRQRMRAKEASRKDLFSSKMMGSAAGSVSGASGTGSGDEGEYYHNFNPIRTGGMLAPHRKAIAPASIKAVSPTPSQTKQTELFTNLMEATPPRGDPIYTEMIGTLGLFGTFYMSKEDMDFCAMRLYSNFKQAQENMERHAILDSIDVMPEIYDILRHCEDSHLTADEKSLLATQLAPHWTNSEEARRALETAVVYTEAEEEAEFWQGLQAATDSLSRYDQIIVTARIVLMFDGSSGQSAAIREAVPLFQQVYKIIRAKCPQWHEGNVQLMGVYLAITFLEYGLNSQTLGVDGQSTTLDWVHGLQPDDLEKFLAEKKDQRMRVLCLDLEPTGIPQQALRDNDEVIRAANSLQSESSPTSSAQMELPFQGADDETPSSAMSPQGLMSMHDQPFDDQSLSYGSMPGSPGSSLLSSNLHTNREAIRQARGGVRDSASGSVITSSSNYSEEEQSEVPESPLSRMSAHSYGPSSLASSAQAGGRGSGGVRRHGTSPIDARQVFESGSTTSQSESEGRHRGTSGGTSQDSEEVGGGFRSGSGSGRRSGVEGGGFRSGSGSGSGHRSGLESGGFRSGSGSGSGRRSGLESGHFRSGSGSGSGHRSGLESGHFRSGSGRGRSGTGSGSGSGSGHRSALDGLASSSFASSHYNEVYGDSSSVESQTPRREDPTVENYFSEQPSGRNLLHVLPHQRGGTTPRDEGRQSQVSPGLGAYREQPSGRGLVHDPSSSDVDDDDGGGGFGARGAAMSSPSESDRSSAWNDTDAQSSNPPTFGGGGGNYAAAQFTTAARSAYSSGGTVQSGRHGTSPVVREVDVYDDVSSSEASMSSAGTEAASRVQSEMTGTYDHDTAAGGSTASFQAGGGDSGRGHRRPGSGASGAPSPGQRMLGYQQGYGSSRSSIVSRVTGAESEMGSHRLVPPQDSWQNSPGPGGGASAGGGIERVLSGETTDSSILEQQARDRHASGQQEDGDFGRVWLADRAHARQFDDADEDRG